QELQDDRRADIRHDAEREDRDLRQIVPGEHVVQAEHAVLAELLRELVERADVDPRHDDVAADTIDEQQREREQNPVPQLGDGEDVLQAVVDCHGNPYAINSAFPPAAWSFSEALPLNLCARTVSFFVMSPRARILMGALPPATIPCSRSSSGVTTVPASNFAASESRLTTSYSTRNGLWNPRFGTRRCSGIWPPSKPRLNLNPERDFAPLWPRPAVLPLPDPCPRPMRFFGCFIPGGGFRSLRL